MSTHTYRLTRRHGAHAAGAELRLTEDEAQQLDNEAPGVLEGPYTAVPAKEAPKVKSDDGVATRRAVVFTEPA